MPEFSRCFRRLALISAVCLLVLAGSTASADDAVVSPPPMDPPVTSAPGPIPAGPTPPSGRSPVAAPPLPSGRPPGPGAAAPPSGDLLVPPAEASAASGASPVAATSANPIEPAADATDPFGQVPVSDRGFPMLPSLTGAVGLFHASTADVGPIHHLRMGLHGEYFGANSFLIDGDSNQRLAGGLAVGYTLRRNIEIFGAILNSSNRNRRSRGLNDRDPELIKTFGDLVLGGKWVMPISPAATFGVELGLKFLSGVSDLATSPSSTSWWLGPIFTYDLRRRAGIPLRLHAGTSFFKDNSSNLVSFKGVTRGTKEVAMFAYGIAPSRLRMVLAADVPLEGLFPQVPFSAFLEYHVEYVTSGADASFRDYMVPNCDSADTSKMPCIENRDIQWLTLGVRASVYRGIIAALGVDLRIRSAGFPYGPPLAPFNVIFGLSYPLDLDALTRTVVVTRTVEKPVSVATEGHLTGVVRSSRGGGPVAGAIVAVGGRMRARAATDPDGGFTTPNLPLGAAEVEVSAANFEPIKVVANVVAGQPIDLAVTLIPNPPGGRVHGRVTDTLGKGIEASIKFVVGGEIHEIRADASGAYSTALPVGPYQVRVDARGLAPKEAQVDLLVGQDKELDFVLRPVVSDPNVVLSGESIKLKKPVRFVGATAKIPPGTEKLLDGVAALLDLHAEIKRVRIVAHWDSSLPKAQAAMLTQHQAEAVRAYLSGRGIAEGRLTPVGAGSTKPLVPNLSPMNRARNRRVELHIE